MATVGTFDTLSVARKLKAAGVSPEQAEAHAEAIAEAVIGGNLVTRDYLDKRLAELQNRILLAHLATVIALLGAMKFLL